MTKPALGFPGKAPKPNSLFYIISAVIETEEINESHRKGQIQSQVYKSFHKAFLTFFDMIQILFLICICVKSDGQQSEQSIGLSENDENYDDSFERTIRNTIAKIRFCLSEPRGQLTYGCDEFLEARSKSNWTRKGCEYLLDRYEADF